MSILLGRFPLARLRVRCERCHRLGDYSTARLIGRHGGDCRLPDLLATLTSGCPGRTGFGSESCRAIFPDLAAGGRAAGSGGPERA